ncbi:hypothetical protein M378DRAFT_743138 [Amanita muscaria Koide BX008]|uniref:DUF6533 domain-containing protein n=1 Tax=Amanita muscaria (strain Koide BX008) TaxID=946122 RepID=A0A0C2WMI7_AMAMK|nr:hypothetical protein M378DRAFT_743138 [Amanita muscaria Koide BX008]
MQTISPLQVFGLRYTSAIGIACILYDHLLTFESERQAIWTNPTVTHLSKFGFFTNRYGSEILGIYLSSVLSATRDLNTSTISQTKRCVTFVWIFSIFASVFVTLSHFAVVLRIYHSWDRGRTVGIILPITFCVALSGISTLAVLSDIQIQPHVVYFAPLRSCSFGYKPATLPAMLGIVSLYDLFIIILTIHHALDMPRRHDIEILRSLQKDSALAFLLFVLRFVNFLLAVFGQGSEAFLLLPIVWLVCAVINARLQIRLEGLAIPTSITNVLPLVHNTESNGRSVEVILLPPRKNSGDMDRGSFSVY